MPINPLPSRRFGRTGLEMPILSMGGMRFQQSWSDLAAQDINYAVQMNLQKTLQCAVDCGFHHLETARHYGSSELQLGWAIQNVLDDQRILQTKIPPKEDPNDFEREIELSFSRLQIDRLDLLAIHGINLPEHLHHTIRLGGCLEVVRRWQANGRIGHVGFSTHGPNDLIVEAIETNAFDFVNLHWYYIFQDNEIALDAAAKFDLGVFIISPTDKGGHLHTPSSDLLRLCKPLHPIVFNDLFCLSDPRIHTISVGAARPSDLNMHLEAVSLLDQAPDLLPRVQSQLMEAANNSLGENWLNTWRIGLPTWQDAPGQMNIRILLWLYNLVEAWGMEGYAQTRYGLLGNGSHWFPGENADQLDCDVSEESLREVLVDSPWKNEIPNMLRKLRNRLTGIAYKPLSGI